MSLSKGGGPGSMSRLNERQRKLMRQLYPIISEGLEKGATPLDTLFTPDELEAHETLRDTFKETLSAIPQLGLFKALETQLSGEPTMELDPSITEELFESSVAAPLRREFIQNILPSLNRSFRGFTSARGKAVQRAGTELSDILADKLAQIQLQTQTQRIQMAENAAARQQGALGLAPGVLGFAPRLATSYASTQAGIGDFVRSEQFRLLPGSNPYLDRAFQFLGINANQIVNRPSTLTGFGTAFTGIQGATSGVASITGGLGIPGLGGFTGQDFI